MERAAAKRAVDALVSLTGLLILSPLLGVVCLLIWLQDWHSPFYVAPRVGLGGKPFRMVKLRSMVIHADTSGVDSTAKDDRRITGVGRFIRRFKLDEVSQLWNVLLGHMSLVGPRPQVERDVRLYTEAERVMLAVRPGITDFSSIVFADEGDILAGSADPDLRYHQVIRPWKSRMALHYVAANNLWLDLRLVLATVVNAVRRPAALVWVSDLLRQTGADPVLVRIALRREPLAAAPPPGADAVVQSR